MDTVKIPNEREAEMKTITIDWLEKENACEDAVQWAASRLNDGRPLSECIAAMERADWLIWLLWHS